MRVALLIVAVLAASCGSPVATASAAPRSSAPPSPLSLAPMEVCGTVKAWTAPTATGTGRLVIGTRTFTVNPGTLHAQTGFFPTPGKDMCVFGGLDGQTAASHGDTLVESPFCGAVLAFAAATPTAAGSITVLHFAAATLAVPPGVDLGHPPAGVRRCFTVGVDASGDALIRDRAGSSFLDLESGLWCGTVKAYAVGSSIAIGSRRWEMASGAAFQSAAVNPPDRTAPGKPTCLTAAMDDNGRITRYRTDDMPLQESGLVTSYLPPTPAAPGTLVFSYRYIRSVPPTVTLPPVVPGARICVTEGLDEVGDRVVTGVIECPPVRVN